MERIYGIPSKLMVSKDDKGMPIQREWLAVADAWLSALKKPSSKLEKGKSTLDPAIAALAGVDENPVAQSSFRFTR